MKPKLEIQINDPCHENWENMSLADKGRFCDVCSKVVVDFTSYSDEQLLDYFSSRQNGREKLCGRFTSDKVFVPKKIVVHERSYYQLNNGIQRFLWLLLVSLGFMVVSCGEDNPKGKVISQQNVELAHDSNVVNSKHSDVSKKDRLDLDKSRPIKSKKVQNCLPSENIHEIMGEPMDVIMGGIAPPQEVVSPEVIKKGETIIGDTIIREQPQIIIKGKVALPKSQPGLLKAEILEKIDINKRGE